MKNDYVNNTTQQNEEIVDLTSYYEFIRLYNKDRPKKLKKIIQKIIIDEKVISERVKKIKTLDSDFANGKVIQNIEEQKHDVIETKKNNPSPQVIKKVNFLQYLFVERQKLINYNTHSNIIQFKLFGIQKMLSPQAIIYWQDYYNKIISFLFKQVYYALLHGWKTLEPLEYNIVSEFYKFLIAYVKQANLIQSNRAIIDNIKIIESFFLPYLIIINNSSYKEILKKSLFEVLFTSNFFKPKIHESIRILEEIINIKQNTMSLFNIILSVYSIYFNYPIKYKHIIKYFNPKPIDENYFYFDQKIIKEIQKYLTSLDEKIKKNQTEIFFLQLVNTTLTFESKKNNEWVKICNNLLSFKEKEKEKENANNSAKINQIKEIEKQEKKFFPDIFSNILNGLIDVSQGFLSFYELFLSNSIDIIFQNKPKNVCIFDKLIFSKAIQNIKNFITNYNYIQFSGQVVSIHFKQLKKFMNRRKSNFTEEKMYQLIKSILETFKEISYKTTQVLCSHHQVSQETLENLLEKYKMQNNTIKHINSDEGRLIPFAFETVNNYLHKKKVINIIHEIAYFTTNILYLFDNKEVLIRLKKVEELVNEIELQLKLKTNLNKYKINI